MEMHPKKKVGLTKYVSLFLIFKEYGDSKFNWWGSRRNEKVKASFLFSILNSDGQRAAQCGGKRVREFGKYSSWGSPKMILSADLLNPAKNLVVDDTLKIHCEIKIIGDMKQKLSNGDKANCSPSSEERSKRFKDGFVNDFGKLFKQEIGTDVTILVGKTGLKAHKAVLTGSIKLSISLI
ncbi:unnamed protein product [Orchesella dallaii]|uniref:MATH domain-containing protein n=1 Tax=Orchesella dallaii TaxID=48710 RepID=A0ABP1R509_9HEXA